MGDCLKDGEGKKRTLANSTVLIQLSFVVRANTKTIIEIKVGGGCLVSYGGS